MVWNGTTAEPILFIDDLNKKHKTIKFDYKISAKQIEFLDNRPTIKQYRIAFQCP